MATPEPSAPDEAAPAGAPRRSWLRAALPHMLTAVVAVAASLAAQAALPRPTPPAGAPPTGVPTLVAPSPLPTPTPTPALAPPPSTDIVRQELIDLHAEDDRLWSAVYLVRALSQVADAEAMLRANNLERVDQLLIAVDDSLALAYERADDAAKDPIEQLRREVSALRDDLYLRPEGMDERLATLRQTILALIEERR